MRTRLRLRVILSGVCLAMALLASCSSSATSPAEPQIVWKAESKTLLDGEIQVESGKDWRVNFKIDDTMRKARVTGNFHAYGGSGNDIKAAIADKDEYENWVNGHAANTIYQTDQITVGKIDESGPLSTGIKAGEYTLGFSNRFSTITDKTVQGSVVLSYERRVN
jgi:hypothetical protein